VIGEWLREQRTTSVKATNARRNAYRAHRKVYEAIVARDPDRAAEAMREHLEEVEAFYWQVTQAGPG
jgi:GntR family transcriptional repressor for pyruvate dehydrogenase complex